jgi:hypothetical protein
MESTEKCCENHEIELKNDVNHAKVVHEEGFMTDFVMQKHVHKLKIEGAKNPKIDIGNGPKNFPEWGCTNDAIFPQNPESIKHHGNDIVMIFKNKNEYNNIVENMDEKISDYREIVKNIPDFIYDKSRKIEKDKKPTTVISERFKNVQPEFKITSLTTFGKHNPEILEEIEMNEIIITKSDGISKLIEHIYFNDRRPQYQNVRLRNIREKLCEFYDGTVWKTIEEKTIIHNIIVYTKDIIDNYYDKNKRKFSKYYQEKYRNFSNSFDEIIIKKMNGNMKNEQYEKIYDKIKILLINKKEIDRVIMEKKKVNITV